MGNEFFTAKEDEWFRRVAPEFARWNNGSRDTAFFISRALQAFYTEFPYRHARNVRHERCTKSERGLVIYGDEYGKMYERLRHKLNYVKNSRKGKNLLSPAPGIVELYTTFEMITARHRGEGFMHDGDNTPYAVNTALNSLKELTATRLHLYGPGDFGCVSNEQRSRYLADLPQDMEDLVETINTHTGAEIYMIAGWNDENGVYNYYDIASKMSQQLLYRGPFDGEGIRTRFINLQRRRNCLACPRTVETALPAVYGAFDGSWRPILPALSMPWECMIPILVAYFEYHWEWQGGELPLPWEDGDLDPESDGRIAQSYRLPTGVRRLTHPDGWTKNTTFKWRDHIYAGQHGEISSKHRFQFYTLSDTQVDSDYRVIMHPNSVLRYEGASRLWTARLLRQEDGDALACDELFFQLPTSPLQGESLRPWDEDELNDISTHSLIFQPLLELLDTILKHERNGPIQAAPGQWTRYWTFSLHFKEEIPGSSAFIQALNGWWIPEGYFQPCSAESDDWCMTKQSEFLRCGIFQHELTRTIFGGPFGVKWAALLLVRSYWTLQTLVDGTKHPYTIKHKKGAQKKERDYVSELRVVEGDIDWLRAELDRSVETLNRAREIAESRVYTTITLPEPNLSRAAPAESPTPTASSRGVTPPPRSILKASADQVKERPTKMVVVLPAPARSKRGAAKQVEGPEDVEMEEEAPQEEEEPEEEVEEELQEEEDSMEWEDEDTSASAPAAASQQSSPVLTPRSKLRRYGKRPPILPTNEETKDAATANTNDDDGCLSGDTQNTYNEQEIDLEDTNSALIDLATLAARIGSNQHPDTDMVQGRLSFWLDSLLRLIGAAADGVVVCAVISRDGDGALYKIASNTTAAPFLNDASVSALSDSFKRWYTCNIATNRSLGPYGSLPFFDDTKPVSLFSSALRQLFVEFQHSLAGLEKLPDLVEAHEKLGPPQGRSPFWHTSTGPDQLLRESFPRPEASDEHLYAWVMENVSFDFTNLRSLTYNFVGPSALLGWFNSSPFRDPITGAMLGGTMGIRLGAVVILRVARTIHELATNPGNYPRSTKYLPHDHIGLVAESYMEILHGDLAKSTVLLQPSANARRLSSIPDLRFGDMLATPESRSMAPISPVEGMQDISSLIFGGARSEEIPQVSSRAQSRGGEGQGTTALGLQLEIGTKQSSRSRSAGDSRSATDNGSRVSSRAPPSSRSIVAPLPPLPENEPSPPRKIRRLPAAAPTVSDPSSGDEGMADSEQSVLPTRRAAPAADAGAPTRPRPKPVVDPADDDDDQFFTRKARRPPTPGPMDEEPDEIEYSDDPPRGRPPSRRSERTPRPVSSAPKLVAAHAKPTKARSSSRVPEPEGPQVKSERRAAADSFALPASDEDIFRRLHQGRDTSTPAEAGRENASKKRSRSRSVAPNAAGPSTQATSGVGGLGLTSVRSVQTARGKGKGRR